MNSNKLLNHEDTYKKKNLVSLIHKNRLNMIVKLFRKYVPSSSIKWADFGCSNGFIAESIEKSSRFDFIKIVGYDHKKELLELALKKNIPNATFKYCDLNKILNVEEKFNMVTCFETLEHVGDYYNAIINLFNHLDKDGMMIIAVPNEVGLIGLFKLLSRPIIRRNVYEDFFSNLSYFTYIKYLLTNDYIDIFRLPDKEGYGPHLGFDFRRMESYIDKNFIRENKLTLIDKKFTTFKMNVVYVLKKN
tara:strand:- start:69 stop:809 length:741 start_codon:yes stop_codon:yes gene_type:complete